MEDSFTNQKKCFLDSNSKSLKLEETDTTDRTCYKTSNNNNMVKNSPTKQGNICKTYHNGQEISRRIPSHNNVKLVKSNTLLEIKKLDEKTQRDITSVLRAIGIHAKRVADGFHDARWANVSFGLRMLLKKMDDKIVGIKNNLGI